MSSKAISSWLALVAPARFCRQPLIYSAMVTPWGCRWPLRRTIGHFSHHDTPLDHPDWHLGILARAVHDADITQRPLTSSRMYPRSAKPGPFRIFHRRFETICHLSLRRANTWRCTRRRYQQALHESRAAKGRSMCACLTLHTV